MPVACFLSSGNVMWLRSVERAGWHVERLTGEDCRLVWPRAAKLGT